MYYIIVSDEFSLMELSEYPFSEGFFNSFEVYFPEAGEDAVFPVSVSEESMKVGVIV